MSNTRAAGAVPIGAFQVVNSRALRHANVQGDVVSVALMSDSSVEIVGKEGGVLILRATDIERIRIGFVEGKRRIYSTRIWRAGGNGAIELIPDTRHWSAYRTFVQKWTALLAADFRADRIELGSSKFQAVLLPALFFPLLAATLYIAVFALRGEPWWGRMIVPLVPAVLFAVFLGQSITRLWPRPMRSAAELENAIPPGAF